MRKLGLLTFFFLLPVYTVFAQFGNISGKVMRINADGTSAPVSGARIDYYRTDVFSKLRTDTTSTDGSFAIVGLPVVGKYAVYASGPGLESDGFINLTAGRENLVIKLKPGNGQYFTESAVQAQMRLFAFNEKIRAEENQEAEDFRLANQLLSDKKYGEAAAAFDAILKKYMFSQRQKEAYRQKAIAANNLAVEAFQAGAKSASAPERQQLTQKAREFSIQAVDAAVLSLNGYRFQSKKPDHKPSPEFSQAHSASSFILFDALRLGVLIRQDVALLSHMTNALNEYLSLNPTPAQRLQVLQACGKTLVTMKAWEMAVPHYALYLKDFPEDLEAISGFATANLIQGSLSTNETVKKEMLQTSADYFQKYLKAAPIGHNLRQDAVTNLAYLKDSLGVEPRAAADTKAVVKPQNALGMWKITVDFKPTPRTFALFLEKPSSTEGGQMFIGNGVNFDVIKVVVSGNSVNFIVMMALGKLPVEFKGTLDPTMTKLNGTFSYTAEGKQETGTWTAIRDE